MMGNHLSQLGQQEEAKAKAAQQPQIREVNRDVGRNGGPRPAPRWAPGDQPIGLPPGEEVPNFNRPPPNPNQVRAWMSDPQLQQILGDPSTQDKLNQLQSLPADQQRAMIQNDAALRRMAEAGILRLG